MQDIEWMNEKAQEAKRRGDYVSFEYWRRAYLLAQAAMWERGKIDRRASVKYNESN